jgi:hypothetical protein
LVLLVVTPSGFFSYNSAFGIAIFAFLIFFVGINKGKVSYLFLAGVISGFAFTFKQNVGLITAAALIPTIIFYPDLKQRVRLVTFYAFGSLLFPFLMFVYFFVNNALGQAIYYILFFASEFKQENFSFVIHRMIFIPVFISSFLLYKRMKTNWRIFLISGLACLIFFYFAQETRRIGRLIDYLTDPIFYIQTALFLIPLATISIIIFKKAKTKKNKNLLLFAIFLLAMFFMKTSQGYDRGIISTLGLFLFPMALIFLKGKVRISAIALVLILSSQFFYNPLATHALHVGNYPMSSMTQYSDINFAALIKFTPEQKEELSKIVHYISQNTHKNERIVCFPYCPMIYILADRPGSTYYGIFGLSNDQERVISELKKERPKIAILIKQGDLILTSSLELDNLKKIKAFILEKYKFVWKTGNFDVYILKN